MIKRARPARTLLINQASDAPLFIPVAPQIHLRPRRPSQLRDLRIAPPLGGQQYDPGTLNDSCRDRLRARHPLQFLTIART